jgi:SAM-dependent methyltransferase
VHDETAHPDDADHLMDTTSLEYTRRLQDLEGATWKRVLRVQAPYQRNIGRSLAGVRTLDLGCGIGRNLQHLSKDSIGVDHNETSVAFCRTRGLVAYLPDAFQTWAHARDAAFDGLLVAHVLEHLEPGTQEAFLREYLPFLSRGARVLLICPQERGYSSDASHLDFVDDSRLLDLCDRLHLTIDESRSFPLPRGAGRLFSHNEFVVRARVTAKSLA